MMINTSKIPVIGITGRSNSGKTTLIERLIPLLKENGFCLAVVKHSHHDLHFDVPGSDTHRYKKAGAATTILASPTGIGVVKELKKEISLDEIILRYADDCDMVIVEGFKRSTIPKIEVFEEQIGEPLLCADGDGTYVAVVADNEVAVPLPRFARDDVNAVAQFIIARFLNGDV